jgi:hypothetical protein
MIKTYLLVSSMFFAVTTSVCAQQAKPYEKPTMSKLGKSKDTVPLRLSVVETSAFQSETNGTLMPDGNKVLQAATEQKVAKRLKISQPNPSSSK